MPCQYLTFFGVPGLCCHLSFPRVFNGTRDSLHNKNTAFWRNSEKIWEKWMVLWNCNYLECLLFFSYIFCSFLTTKVICTCIYVWLILNSVTWKMLNKGHFYNKRAGNWLKLRLVRWISLVISPNSSIILIDSFHGEQNPEIVWVNSPGWQYSMHVIKHHFG